jgi:hypothetical protein
LKQSYSDLFEIKITTMTDILLKFRNQLGKCLTTNDTVNHIKLFTGELIEKNGKYCRIQKIPKNDPRYEMLRKRPRIRQVYNNDMTRQYPLKGSVWFKINGKFMVINVGYQDFWNGTRKVSGQLIELHYNSTVTLNRIL